MSSLIIFNPVLNRFKKQVLKQLRSQLNERSDPWRWIKTTGDFNQDLDAIIQLIKSETVHQVIVLGGDGTLHLAANALALTDIPVGYIPCGSGNDFARLWYGPKQRKQIGVLIDTAFHADSRAIDLGRVGNRYFVNVAGLGFDGALIQHMRNRRLWLPALSYIMFALFMLPFYRGTPLTIKAAGKKLSGLDGQKSFMLSLGNGKYYGGGLPIAPHATTDDGLLAWCHVEDCGFLRNTRSLIQLLREKHLDCHSVRAGQTETLSVLTPGIPVQADGEYLGQTPAVFSVKKHALRLRAP